MTEDNILDCIIWELTDNNDPFSDDELLKKYSRFVDELGGEDADVVDDFCEYIFDVEKFSFKVGFRVAVQLLTKGTLEVKLV